MADGFICPWCENDPAARPGCRRCNGAGVIGAHDMPEAAEPRTELAIDVRGRPEPASVVELPFYRRNKHVA